VNLACINLNPLAFILHFFKKSFGLQVGWFAVSVKQWLDHCPWLLLQYRQGCFGSETVVVGNWLAENCCGSGMGTVQEGRKWGMFVIRSQYRMTGEDTAYLEDQVHAVVNCRVCEIRIPIIPSFWHHHL
jgi:hypothetical protein